MSSFRIDRLELLMDALSMSSGELAELSNLSYNFIYKLRTGARLDAAASHVASMARALNTNTDYLLGLTDDPRPNPPPEEANELLARLKVENPRLAWMYETICPGRNSSRRSRSTTQ